MNRNHVRVILIQVFIAISASQGQRTTNTEGAFTAPLYQATSYYPSHVFPYQYPYGSASSMYYPSQSAVAPFPYPSYPAALPTNATTFAQGLPVSQQYFLGPMNAAQAQYLLAHIQNLMRYGANSSAAPQVQIPSTPTLNASSIQPTPASAVAPLEPINTTLVNNTDELTNCSTSESNATSSITQTSNVSDPILGTAQLPPNPFLPNPSYTIGNWLYNPFASMQANLPLRQPFYPPGFGSWNPFVLSPPLLPMPQSNTTQQAALLVNNFNAKSSSQNGQGSSSKTPTIIGSAGEGGMTDTENLPEEVKEFINMIPDILSMPESSQLNPSNNALIHRLGGGSRATTPVPRFHRPKGSLRFKKEYFKPHRSHEKNILKK